MSITDRTTLKSYYTTGARPTQSQFGDLIDTLVSMGISDTNTGSVNFSGCLSISGSISASVAQFSSSVLVSGSLIAAGAASVAGSAFIVGRTYIGASDNGGTCNNGININVLSSSQDAITLRSNIIGPIGPSSQHENNVFGSFGPIEACGGFILRGLSSGCRGLSMQAFANTYTNTRSTAGIAAWQVAIFTSVSSTSNPPADTNIVVFRAGTNTRFIWDSDGDFHADAAVSASAYDSHDDIGLVRSLEVERVPDLRKEFGNWARYNKDELERLRIATFNDGRPGRDNDGSVFVNYTALTRLHSGAIWQLAQKISDLEKKLLPSGCNYIDLLDTS